MIGKGSDFHLPVIEGLFDVTREFSNDQQALADLLNECEVLYSYDPNSAMFEIARLCGCRVEIIPSLYTKKQFSKYEPGMNGITFYRDETNPLDADEFRCHYQDMKVIFDYQLDRFIEETQSAV